MRIRSPLSYSCLVLLVAGPAWTAPQSRPIIPLCPGLKVVTAVSQTTGDYESIKRLVSVSPEGLTFHYSSEFLVDDPFSNMPPQTKSLQVTRRVSVQDQAEARFYLAAFSDKLPESVPGSTSLGPSMAIYEALKKTGKSEISLVSLVNDSATLENSTDPDSPFHWGKAPSVYVLELPDPKPIPVRVLVNGRPRRLPALKVNGDFAGDKAEFLILDDPTNPLILLFRLGVGHNDAFTQMLLADPKLNEDPALKEILLKGASAGERDRLQVVQISYDCQPGQDLEGAIGWGELPTISGEFDVDLGELETEGSLFETGGEGLGTGPGGDGSSGSVPGGLGSLPSGEMAGSGGLGQGQAGGVGDGAGAAGAGNGSGATAGAARNQGGGKVQALEQALAKGEKVDIYDIFFSFNSAELRRESEDTLKLIAELLAKHPDWSLAIGGHTDSVASDAFNLELSQRRAAAVKGALVQQYGITDARLTTQGYGEGSPRDTNDTAEGRALNRRVELMRTAAPG